MPELNYHELQRASARLRDELLGEAPAHWLFSGCPESGQEQLDLYELFETGSVEVEVAGRKIQISLDFKELFQEKPHAEVEESRALGNDGPGENFHEEPCIYCNHENPVVRSTYYDQTCPGCVRRMGRANGEKD